jgi:hypothetical protein
MSLQGEVLRLIEEAIALGSFTLLNGRIVQLKDADIMRLMALVISRRVDSARSAQVSSLVPLDMYLNGQIPIDRSEFDFDALERQINNPSGSA